jgi:curved DNA-binding protein CbpA
MKDFYRILGVTLNFNQDELRARYRFLIKAWHPDQFTDQTQIYFATEMLKDINLAYEILSNPTYRYYYDQERAEKILSGELEIEEEFEPDPTIPPSERERKRAEARQRRKEQLAWEKVRTEAIWRQWKAAEKEKADRSHDPSPDWLIIFALLLAVIAFITYWILSQVGAWNW